MLSNWEFDDWIDNLDNRDIDHFYNLMMNGQMDDVMNAFRYDVEYDDYGEFDDYGRYYDDYYGDEYDYFYDEDTLDGPVNGGANGGTETDGANGNPQVCAKLPCLTCLLTVFFLQTTWTYLSV